ncbi:hypothetical protein ACFVXA_12350 [Streptomyces sp. NPDC058246]|uniref:hypothetical protein n=1 Tax=Streptomyces sp. NPDC058246 TaxID=3346400 RepID=UPI0036EC0EBC
MPQHHPDTRVCPDCNGFASVAVTTGARHRDGSRVTLRIDCRACKGAGIVLVRRPILASVGR